MRASDYDGCPMPVQGDNGTEPCGDMKLVFQSNTSGVNLWSCRCGVGHELSFNGMELIFDLDEKVDVE